MTPDKRNEAEEAELASKVDALFAELEEEDEATSLGPLEEVEGRWHLRLDPMVRQATSTLARNFAEILDDADPAAARPTLYLDDPEAEASWQARGDRRLLEDRQGAVATLRAALEGADLGEDEVLSCVKAMTDIRFTLYKVAGQPASWQDAEEPLDQVHHIYLFLGWLSSSIIAAVG